MGFRRSSRSSSHVESVSGYNDKPSALPSVRRHRPDYQIVLFIGLLMLIGLVLLYSISPARVEVINANSNVALDTTHFMERQLLNLGVGLAVFIGTAMVPPAFWRRWAGHILIAGLGACLVLSFLGLFMDGGLVIKTNGAVRWFNLGVSSFQPSELLKFGFILFGAVFLGRRVQQGNINSQTETVLPMALLFGAAALLIIVFQKDMGTGITLAGIMLAMLYAAGLNKRWLSIGAIAAVVAGVLLIVTAPHRIARVLTFLSPADVSDASSYHINQALIALGSGGFFGKGLGQGVQAFGYLPEALNDSIFAIYGETFGFVGVIIIIVLFGALLRRLLKVMDTTVDPSLRLMVAGVFGLIATHVVVNIGAMIGVLPLTGVTLPFLSFGGTSLLFTMLGLGVVFAISRYTTHQDINKREDKNEATERRGRLGRSRYAGSSRY